MPKRTKIGLALGGGGARGIAHIGVLKVLERENIPIDVIVGSSIGALVGAAYAVNPDATALEKRVAEVLDSESKETASLKLLGRMQWDSDLKNDFLHRIVRIAQKEVFLSFAVFRNALLSENDLHQCVNAFVSDIDIEQTAIPFAAATLDLVSGRLVLLKKGSLVRSVMASCAIPGFMPAITWDEMILVDGGVIDAIPAGPARDSGADRVIGVDVRSCLRRDCAIEDGIDSINRAMEIMTFCLGQTGRQLADVLIEPDVREFAWTDFFNYKELIHQGEKAVESKIQEIRRLFKDSLSKKVMLWPKRMIRGISISTRARNI